MPYLPYILTALLAASCHFAFAPYNLWWLMLAFLSAWLFYSQRVSRPYLFTWVVFSIYFLAGLNWIHISLDQYGGVPVWGSTLMVCGLAAYLALFPVLAIYLQRRLKLNLFALPFTFALSEYLRSLVLTGFPWLSLGYSQQYGPFAPWYAIVGETGVTSITLISTILIVSILGQRQRYWRYASLISLLIASYLLSHIQWLAQKPGGPSIAMVQGNIEAGLRWRPEDDEPTMHLYRELSQGLWSADIIIWPESAIPKLEVASQGFLYQLEQQAVQTNTALITGIIDYDYLNGKVFNNLIVLGQDKAEDVQGHYYYQHPNRYAKHHLLPIGEVVPFEQYLKHLAPIFDLPMSSFTRGAYRQDNLRAKGFAFAPAICFEIVFPRQIRANLHSDTAAILTVSNDAWFGDSVGPHQHMQIAQIRAMEFGLPVIRSTNNGITGVIDVNGRIISQFAQFEAGSLTSRLPLYQGHTPYRQFGDWYNWLLTGILLCLALIHKLKGRQKVLHVTRFEQH